MPAICHNRRTTTFYNFSTTFEAKRMAQEDTRRMKKISRIEYCAGFEPLQSGMEQDEGSRILLPTMKPVGADKKADVSPKKVRVLDETKIEVEPLFEEYVDFDSFAACDFRAVKIKACTEVPKSKKLLKFVLNDGSGTDRIILSGIHGYYEPEELVGKTAVAITNLPPRKMMGEESNGMLLSCINKYDGEEMLNFIMLDDQIPAGAKVY